MTRIMLDPSLRQQLPDLSQPFEVCDEAGKIMGRYLPQSDVLKIQREPPLSREEIERRKQNKGKTYTTTEVLAHLETL